MLASARGDGQRAAHVSGPAPTRTRRARRASCRAGRQVGARGAPVDSLATNAPSTSAPPSSTCAARRLVRTEPGPGDAEDDLEQRQQAPTSGAGEHARRGDRDEARHRELGDAEQGEQRDVVRRRHAAAARSGKRDERRQHGADQHGGEQIGAAAPAALDRRPVERGRDRHRRARSPCRRAGAGRRRASSWAYIQPMPRPATTIAAQVRARQALAEDDARDERGEQRRDRHRDEHVGHRGHRDRDHEGGEHHRPARAREPERRVARSPRCGAAPPQPRSRPSRTISASALKKLRQKVASNAGRRVEMAGDDAGHAPEQRRQRPSRRRRAGARSAQ